MNTQTNNNAGKDQLQGPMQAGIRKANDKAASHRVIGKEVTLLNTSRAIYDFLVKETTGTLVVELQDALEPFGYHAATVAATVTNMYKAGLLTRTNKSPYAYMWNEEATPPDETLVNIVVAPTRAQQKTKERAGRAAEEAKKNQLPQRREVDKQSTEQLLQGLAENMANGDIRALEHSVQMIKDHLDSIVRGVKTVHAVSAMIRANGKIK
jgi:predicted DNA-binding transcriptional regulator